MHTNMETLEQLTERINSLGYPEAKDGDKLTILHPQNVKEEDQTSVVFVMKDGVWVIQD